MRNAGQARHLVRDLLVVAGSIVIAIVLADSGVIGNLAKIDGNFVVLSSFIAGIFFTSILTLAPAGVALLAISKSSSPFLVTSFAALGAMCVDLLLVSFIRKDISEDLKVVSRLAVRKYIIQAFHFGFLKWIALFIGLFIVATPLPDELGLFFIGVSKVKTWALPIIFYLSHFLGIFALLSIAAAL